jgi:hypothetical protein
VSLLSVGIWIASSAPIYEPLDRRAGRRKPRGLTGCGSAATSTTTGTETEIKPTPAELKEAKTAQGERAVDGWHSRSSLAKLC